ncbi:MAG TPA: hypothetical protein PLU30_12580 [Verrucomicrobiae bacterium]|nr:hypothetical protein [Verrucomicrobiae bacterium]
MRRRRIGNRSRRSREEISGTIEEYERSGLTQRDFAANRGVALATLGGWLRRARRARFIEVRAEGAPKAEFVGADLLDGSGPPITRQEVETATKCFLKGKKRVVGMLGTFGVRDASGPEGHGGLLD